MTRFVLFSGTTVSYIISNACYQFAYRSYAQFQFVYFDSLHNLLLAYYTNEGRLLPIGGAQPHSATITRVRQDLVDNMRRLDPILTALLKDDRILKVEHDQIKSHAVIHEVVGHLLDVLIKKTAETYDCFLDALSETKQDHLRRLLTDQGQHKIYLHVELYLYP